MSPSPESEDVSGQQRRRRDARSSGSESPGAPDSSWADVVGLQGGPNSGGDDGEPASFFEPPARRDRSNRQPDAAPPGTPPGGSPAGVDPNRPWWAGAGGAGAGQQSSPFQPGSAFGSGPIFGTGQPPAPPAAPPAPPAQAPSPAVSSDFFTPATPPASYPPPAYEQPQPYEAPRYETPQPYEPPAYEPPAYEPPQYEQPQQPPQQQPQQQPQQYEPPAPEPPATPFAPPAPVPGPTAFSPPTAFRPSTAPAPYEPPPSFGARRAEAPPSFGRAPSTPSTPSAPSAPAGPAVPEPPAAPAPGADPAPRELPEYDRPRYGGPVYTPPTYDEFPQSRKEFDEAPPTGTTPVVHSVDFPAPLEAPAPYTDLIDYSGLADPLGHPAPWESSSALPPAPLPSLPEPAAPAPIIPASAAPLNPPPSPPATPDPPTTPNPLSSERPGDPDETGPIDLPAGSGRPPRRSLADRARDRRGSGLTGGLTGGIGTLRRSAGAAAGGAAAAGAAGAAANAAPGIAAAGAAGAAASAAAGAAGALPGARPGGVPGPASPHPDSPATGHPVTRGHDAPPTGALPSFSDVLTGPISLPSLGGPPAGPGGPGGPGGRGPKGGKVRRPRNDEPMLEPMDGLDYGDTMLPLDEAHEQQLEAEAAARHQPHGLLGLPAPAPATGKAGRNLPAAIAVGVGLGGIAAASLFTRPEAFVAVVSIVAVLAVWELAGAMAAKDIMVPVVPLAVGSVGMLVSAYVAGQEGLLVSFTLTGFGLLLWRIIDGVEGAARDVTAGIFVAAYVPLLAGFAVLMLADGPLYVVTFIAVTVSSDIGGYALGAVAGRHPMAPKVSPKKSWEGFAGSVIACLAVGAGTVTLLLHGDPVAGLALGAATVVSATLGDLAESLLKRDLNVKDMGNLLPGHGGLMDRLDSLLPTAPLAFLILHQLVALG